jgi:hypothetical protein
MHALPEQVQLRRRKRFFQLDPGDTPVIPLDILDLMGSGQMINAKQ